MDVVGSSQGKTKTDDTWLTRRAGVTPEGGSSIPPLHSGEKATAARPGNILVDELGTDWTRDHPEGSPPLVILGDESPEDGPVGVLGAGVSQAMAWRRDIERLEAAGVSLTPPPPSNKPTRDVVIPETPNTPADTGIIRGRTLARTPPERRSQSEGLARSGAAAAPGLQPEPGNIHPMGGTGGGGNPSNRPLSGPLGAPAGGPTIRSVEVLGRVGGDGGALYQGPMPPELPPPSTSNPMSEALPRAKRMTSEEKLEARLEEVGSLLRELVRECRDLKATVAAGKVTKARVATLTDGIIDRCEVASTAVLEAQAYHDVMVARAKAKGKPTKNQPKGLIQSSLPVIRRPLTVDMATQTVEVVDPRGPGISVPGEAQGASPKVVVGDKTPPSKKGVCRRPHNLRGRGRG